MDGILADELVLDITVACKDGFSFLFHVDILAQRSDGCLVALGAKYGITGPVIGDLGVSFLRGSFYTYVLMDGMGIIVYCILFWFYCICWMGGREGYWGGG